MSNSLIISAAYLEALSLATKEAKENQTLEGQRHIAKTASNTFAKEAKKLGLSDDDAKLMQNELYLHVLAELESSVNVDTSDELQKELEDAIFNSLLNDLVN